MILNFLRLTLRHLWRDKWTAFITLLGLTVGLTCSLLIGLWIWDELSFDRFHENAPSIYRVVEEQHYSAQVLHLAQTPGPLAGAMIADFPEVVDAVRLRRSGSTLLVRDETPYQVENTIIADPSIFSVFSFPLMTGDPQLVFDNPHSVVLSRSSARRIFGDENPIGQILRYDNQVDLEVTGVMADFPHNSHLRADIITPFKRLEEERSRFKKWDDHSIYTYVQLQAGVGQADFDAKITDFLDHYLDGPPVTLHLQPLLDIRLRSSFGIGKRGAGAIRYVYIFGFIALGILAISAINFVSLMTARSGSRALEVGLRKVLGAYRSQLARQFIGETVVTTLLCLIVSLILMQLLLPVFNEVTGKDFSSRFIIKPGTILGMGAVALLTGLIAGSYPAFVLSALQPAAVLRGARTAGAKGAVFRRALVFFQWTVSTLLIIAAFVVHNQLQYMRDRDIGYEREDVIYLPLNAGIREQYEALRYELSRYPDISGVSASLSVPTRLGSTSRFHWEGRNTDENLLFTFCSVDYDFVETMRMNMAAGRSFRREYATDVGQAVVVNETAVKEMGLADPVGKRFDIWSQPAQIIGVVEDFNFLSMREEIDPLVLFIDPDWFKYLLIRVANHNLPGTIAYVESLWKEMSPQYPFEYHFLDEAFERLYRNEIRMSALFSIITLVAIIIAALGLFALTAYMAERRTKEIGVRKVLGAGVMDILRLMSREFVLMATAANVIAVPVAWYAMRGWLNNYAYRISLDPGLFLLAVTISVVLVLGVVNGRAARAALLNPAESLRYE
ncbi:MAG: ABC transporter permease [Fidelibacterota bacterium]|nr:MAG: ABC transporter permease [Candidatus Neomarinimicrobiota bacterium]